MLGPFIPPTPDEPVDSSPPVDLDNDYANDEFNNHNIEEVAADRFDSDFENEIPDGVPRASTISHLLHGNDDDDNDDDDNDDDDDDNDDDDVDEELLVVSTRNGHKYEYCDQNEFLTSPDDTVHVLLADLCCCIHAPLYAYDETLEWAQEAHLNGYHFSPNAPKYRSMLLSLSSCLCLGHLSHCTSTIRMCGGGRLDFPTCDFKSMFYDLIDDHCISPHLLINFECPNKPPSFNPQLLNEVHTRKWHHETSRKLLHDANDVLCGIIFFPTALMFPIRRSSPCTH
jgi:hypothetical protein